MFNEEEYLLMSGIQHFCFCRRQWALIHLEQLWEENIHTAEGRLDHVRCHDGAIKEKRGQLIIVRDVRVVSHQLKLSGACDVVEFRKDPKGITIQYSDGKWSPMPVEYKHGHSKENDADRLQLCAQVMGLEEMLSCPISEGALYYAQTRRREVVLITEELRNKTKAMAEEMWDYYQKGYTPKVKTGKYCKACSLKDVCLPQLCRKQDAKDYIDKVLNEQL